MFMIPRDWGMDFVLVLAVRSGSCGGVALDIQWALKVQRFHLRESRYLDGKWAAKIDPQNQYHDIENTFLFFLSILS